MIDRSAKSEAYLSAAELAAEFRRRGVEVSRLLARELIRATPGRLGLTARFSAVLAFWEANPDFAMGAGRKRR